MCQSTVLTQKGAAIISQCMDCKLITIWHHNLLLNFTPGQFKAFKDFTINLDQADYFFHFPDGDERLVLRTPNNDICFAFTEEEWDNFRVAMEEAEYMQDVYDLLSCRN
jgi:hypothetical protein